MWSPLPVSRSPPVDRYRRLHGPCRRFAASPAKGLSALSVRSLTRCTMVPDSDVEARCTLSMTARIIATPRPRGELASGITPLSAAASKPFPAFLTLISQHRPSTCTETSYSSSPAAWSKTFVHASLTAKQTSSMQPWSAPTRRSRSDTAARTKPTVCASWGRHTVRPILNFAPWYA